MSNKLRIIGGNWRSRQITFDDAPGLRPTPARVRETLFNWLQMDIVKSRCLDLYAGSGALGLEAASRGAGAVVLVESNAKTCKTLHDNIKQLNADQVSVVATDVTVFLSRPAEQYNLVFLDPPFGQSLVQSTCHALDKNGWLAAYAKIYVEAESRLVLDGMPTGWELLKHKSAGEVGYYLFQATHGAN